MATADLPRISTTLTDVIASRQHPLQTLGLAGQAPGQRRELSLSRRRACRAAWGPRRAAARQLAQIVGELAARLEKHLWPRPTRPQLRDPPGELVQVRQLRRAAVH